MLCTSVLKPITITWAPSKVPLDFQIFENAFCIFFVFEFFVRFIAFINKIHYLHDHWFKLDFVLIVLMVYETWFVPNLIANSEVPTQLLRLLRLPRRSRLLKLLHGFTELVTMLKGMWVASRAVISSLVPAIMFVDVLAIIMHLVMAES